MTLARQTLFLHVVAAGRWTRPLELRSSGRRTFDSGLDAWGGTEWPGVPSFVVTHRARQTLVADTGGIGRGRRLLSMYQRPRRPQRPPTKEAG
jgi:hypothetical protein